MPVSRSKNLRTVERKRSLHFHVYLPTFVPRSKKIFASSLEIPNLCIMPPMIKYSPACKSKSRRENPTSHIYIHVCIRARTILSSRGGWPEEGVRLVIKMQNSSAFNCMEYRNIRRQVDIPGYLETRRKNVPPREISSPKMACLPNPARVAIYNIPKDHPAFPITRKGRTYYTVLDARQRRSFSSSLLFFPLYPTGNGISNSSWNGRAELDPNCKPQTLASIPSP